MGWLPRFLGLGAIGWACASGGCSEAPKPGTPAAQEPEPAETTGAVGLELHLANGAKLDGAEYVVTGPGSFNRSGRLDLRNSSTISTIIGGIPAAAGYVASIAASTDAGTNCAGSATFAVTAHATAIVVVQVSCREGSTQGNAMIGGRINFCPVIDALGADLAEVNLGRRIALTAAAHDSDSGPSPLAYQWQATGGTLSNATSSQPTFTCTAVGSAGISLTVTDGVCTDTIATTVTCSQPVLPVVKINEVESNGGVPGDWVELYNAGSTSVDVSGWVFKDNDDGHTYVLPAGTSIDAGGYLLLEEASFGFGLGAADSARLYDDTGIVLVDSHTWTAHAPVTYGRCPNGAGPFVPTASTKGSANDCGAADAAANDASTAADAGTEAGIDASSGDGASADATPAEAAASDATDGAVATSPWPGDNAVVTVDGVNVFGANMSGLTYQPAAGGSPAVLWAVQNNPALLYRLVYDGTIWTSSTADDWGTGKTLRYTTNTGIPDSESVAKAEWDSPAIYVSTERDNNVSGTSRLSVLRFDTSAPGATLVATNDWNLTADLPAVGSNLGLEAITWVPDTYLVANGFIDESAGLAYDPSRYPNHGGGIFFLGIEANGIIYAYALDHTGGGFQRVATFSSGHVGIMGIEFDRDVGYLWAQCDNTCGNKVSVLTIDTDPLSPTRGRFRVRRFFDRPSTLGDFNHEGIAIAPETECVNNRKPFFWSDDNQTGGHALRRDSIPCGPFL